jgi:hypothetical protein
LLTLTLFLVLKNQEEKIQLPYSLGLPEGTKIPYKSIMHVKYQVKKKDFLQLIQKILLYLFLILIIILLTECKSESSDPFLNEPLL